MKINATLQGDFGCKGIKATGSHARVFLGTLQAKFSEAEVESIFGETFANLAFTGLDMDEDGDVTWGYKRCTPDVKCEKHTIEINGIAGNKRLSAAVIPEVTKIQPSVDGPQVQVTINLPIELNDKLKLGELATAVGEVVEVAMEPQQRVLPGTEGAAP